MPDMYEHDSSSAENRLMSSHRGERHPDRFECFYAAHYQGIAGYVRRRVAADEADDVITKMRRRRRSLAQIGLYC